jgi:hypothetical protein
MGAILSDIVFLVFLLRKESAIEDSGFGKSLIYLPNDC